MPISEDLRSMLVCPQCKGDLRDEQDPERLICDRCGLIFLVVDDIPDMLVENAQRIAKA